MRSYFILLVTAISIHFAQKPGTLVFKNSDSKTTNNPPHFFKSPGYIVWTDTSSVFLEKSEGSITVTKGTKFRVRFPERAGGTGYSWNMVSASTLCKLIHTEMT